MNCKIGVDGGATKTECILADEHGAILARHLAPGCSPSHLEAKRAGEIVDEALAALLGKASDAKRIRVGSLLLCMAGNREFWREYAASLAGFGRVVAVDDSLPILELATAGQPGLVLHGGTGSFVAARTTPETPENFRAVHYAGGLGWRFGDPGSGYDLGRRAVGRALLELQGWMSASGIGSLVCAQTGLKDAGAISRLYYGKPGAEAGLAALAPGVLHLAAERDHAAYAMVVDSTSKLLDLAVRVATKLFPTKPIRSLRAGLSGPILTDPTVVKILVDRSPLPLEAIKEPAIEGVRRLLDMI